MPASEFASEFARKHLETDVTVGATRLMRNLDGSLQEVRGVLWGLRLHDDCWCEDRSNKDAPHTATCQRARALYRRLTVKE